MSVTAVLQTPTFVAGLDLGQASDFSAMVVVERSKPEAEGPPLFACRHIHRWPLGTSYPAIVGEVRTLFESPPLAGQSLVIDGTGVGRAVVDQFRAAKVNGSVRAYTITAGHQPGKNRKTVPKKDLVGCLQTLLGQRRLRIAESLPLAAVLAKELETFRAKVTAARNEVFESWRERDHDDVVLALALACWYAERGRAFSVVDLPSLPPPPEWKTIFR